MLDQISLSGLICPFCPRVTLRGNCTIVPCLVWSALVKGQHTPQEAGPVHNFLCKKAAQNSEGNDPFCIAPDSPRWWALEHGLSVQVPVARYRVRARPGPAHIFSLRLDSGAAESRSAYTSAEWHLYGFLRSVDSVIVQHCHLSSREIKG